MLRRPIDEALSLVKLRQANPIGYDLDNFHYEKYTKTGVNCDFCGIWRFPRAGWDVVKKFRNYLVGSIWRLIAANASDTGLWVCTPCYMHYQNNDRWPSGILGYPLVTVKMIRHVE